MFIWSERTDVNNDVLMFMCILFWPTVGLNGTVVVQRRHILFIIADWWWRCYRTVCRSYDQSCNDSMYQPVVRDESVVSRPVSIQTLCLLPTVSTLTVVCSGWIVSSRCVTVFLQPMLFCHQIRWRCFSSRCVPVFFQPVCYGTVGLATRSVTASFGLFVVPPQVGWHVGRIYIWTASPVRRK